MYRLTLLAAVLLVAVLTSPPNLCADTLTVRKDGSGQFTTINAAKAVAVSGDIIEVGPGTYNEEIDFSISVTLVSTDGAETTVLDGEGIRRILIFRAGLGSVIDGFTIRRGYHASSGGALRVQLGATATVRNCVFEDNYVEFDGGAVICRDGSRLDIENCAFRNNSAARHAGAVLAVVGGIVDIDHCTFIENDGPSSGAIATESGAVLEVTNSLFVSNSGYTSAIYAGDGSATIVGNTFYGNTGAVTVWMLLVAVTDRNIFAEQQDGIALATGGPTTCNIYWSNEQGSVYGGLGQNDVEADPIFCDAANGDYTISIHSPAAPANSACGQLIGAFESNCDIEPPPPPVVEPVILSIADVPNDDGLQVRIRWERADYDAPQQPYVITGYAVYRKQYDNARAARPDAAVGRGKGVAIDGWDYIATVPARGDNIYQVVAPTLCDLTRTNECYSTFFVSAMTTNPLVYFDSEPATGYSVDNIAPGAPGALTVDMTSTGANLTWEPAEDADVVAYFVYRTIGTEALGEPIHTATNLGNLEWTDAGGSGNARYWVAAVDDGGNVGEPIGSDSYTGAGPIPNAYFLGQNAPNPFNPSTTIEFGLPAGASGTVTINIFDVTGRLVRSLLNESRSAGTWRVSWDGVTNTGTRASSGVYFYRLQTPKFTETRRMTLIE